MTTRSEFDQGYYDEVLPRWQHPTGFDSDANFIGTKPSGYVIASRTRDSSLLEESNFESILKDLGGESDSVDVIRHGHWACGWVKYLIVKRDAETKLLDRCVDIVRDLADYPVYDENEYRNRQYEAICSYWEAANLRERVELCQESKVTVFAARRDEIPERVLDALTGSDSFF